MERLHVELIGTLQFDEAHRWPCCRLGDRFCVPVIVLLRLYIRPDIFRRHQPDLMTFIHVPSFSADVGDGLGQVMMACPLEKVVWLLNKLAAVCPLGIPVKTMPCVGSALL